MGNFLFSIGPNTDAGGDRRTPCHLDIPMLRCLLQVDGQQVLDKGAVVPKSQQPAEPKA